MRLTDDYLYVTDQKANIGILNDRLEGFQEKHGCKFNLEKTQTAAKVCRWIGKLIDFRTVSVLPYITHDEQSIACDSKKNFSTPSVSTTLNTYYVTSRTNSKVSL
jgi:hypothetical protein